MTKFQHKLIMLYEFKQLGKKMTPLRKFLWSIGLDYRDMTSKQVDQWAEKKRYKLYKQRNKIKSIIKHSQVQEEKSSIPMSPTWPSRSAIRRKRALKRIKDFKLDVLNHGGIEKSGEGEMLYKIPHQSTSQTHSHRLRSFKAIGSNKIAVLKRRMSFDPKGGHRSIYTHKTLDSPKGRFR
jgi:hypothetical protein